MTNKRRILITSALPYANGDIHIGHMVEHLITDFWSRFQKMRGHECLAICADDTHGAPIMVEARRLGIKPEEQIASMHEKHIKDFADFDVIYDNYHTTHSPLNQQLCEEFYLKLRDNGHIEKRSIKQTYCEHDKMFLPDRFVKGTCPKCGATDQYGDSCDVCGSVYNPIEMKDARCTICGNTPIEKESEHHFCKLSNFADFLKEWVPKHTSEGVAKKLSEWLDNELQDWCLTRAEPYFGFEVPGAKGKYYYVWFDAPIGYIASTWDWCKKNNRNLDEFWRNDQAEIYHNIGKDIIYFHSLFWPVMLKNAGYTTPKEIFVHGMLTVNGEKLSKSKGTFINARTYLNHLDPSYLRYYMACKLNSGIADLDLNWEDFLSRVNSDLIGKITNIASRGAQMLQKRLDGKMGHLPKLGQELVSKAQAKSDLIASLYEERQFAKAILEIREIADQANKYFDEMTPWKLIKEDPEETKEVLTTILNLFRLVSIYLKPILPSYVAKVEELFGDQPYTWDDVHTIVEGRTLNSFSHLLQRVDVKKINAITEESIAEQEKRKASANQASSEQSPIEVDPVEPEIEIGDFAKIDLRVAKVSKAESVPKASKLLKLELDLGPLGKRTVFAGIKSAYEPAELEGSLVVVVANLKARKMKFGTSEGMVLAAGPGGKDIWVINPQEGSKPGMRIN